jgi:FlaA1/EpsC-like NDP-sugar epimerase
MRLVRDVNWLRVLLAGIDVCLLNLGVLLAHWLRFEGRLPVTDVYWFYADAGYMPLAAIAIFYAFGLYNRVWQYASSEAVVSILGAVTTTVVLTGGILYVVHSAAFRPTTLLTLWLVWLFMVGGSRFAWRVVREYQHHGAAGNGDQPRRRVLIYGAGEAGAALARQIEHERENLYEVVAFVDDDPHKRNMMVRRLRVIGSGDDLVKLVPREAIDEVLIAIPSASGAKRRHIVDCCRAAKVRYRTLPLLVEAPGAPVSASQLRDVNVSDLLSRDPADFPVEECGVYLEGQCVLVTGAGGSIGAEICRQVARFGPRKLVLLGRGENRIHDIYQELRAHSPEMQIVPVIGSFATPGVASEAFARHRPDVVFHAGAHKHVYLMEANVTEAVRNNVLGTQLVLDAAGRTGVERFVLISTDKAVEPRSVMGATKCLCELLAAAAGATYPEMQVTTVRFGNVLGTNGSVLRIFQNQLGTGRPLTITHPEATRYFMSCEEAALLVLDAGGRNHKGGMFILDMGEPVRIRDLAGELVRLTGGDPDNERNYEYIGLLPGEKLHEELSNAWEQLERASSYLFRVAQPARPTPGAIAQALADLQVAIVRGDEDELRRLLFRQTATLCAASSGVRTPAPAVVSGGATNQPRDQGTARAVSPGG